jgi:hypothetical protein
VTEVIWAPQAIQDVEVIRAHVTHDSLGVGIPASVKLRADHVID